MPDWIMFPSGPSPPIRVATTSDLVSLITRRPPPAEITLLVTFGAKKVAEFQFLSRSDFTIGSSTYVVSAAQDERARARYKCLVLGERLLTSERVMTEIFGEQEILILHRVALEMAYADRVL
ncbi:SWIM-type domain-containing protein [Raphanus sativus]|nr:SWIM-type domain-containing protein [Raphanus sativus]